MTRIHNETHLVGRIGWLRAAVLGANDGIISTASLILGVASAAASQTNVLLAGIAGLVAGAMSMAAGEYVSVSSQSDTENADLAREKRELTNDPEFEKKELANIYVSRGVEQGLARQVAEQRSAHSAVRSGSRTDGNAGLGRYRSQAYAGCQQWRNFGPSGTLLVACTRRCGSCAVCARE
jgi:VIT1/CCC1 family predicted Fe2+/Mn2+ transporter